jgi:hypothetical protein
VLDTPGIESKGDLTIEAGLIAEDIDDLILK